MRAELVFFGRTLNMARRSRRRALVVAIYAALAGLLVLVLVTKANLNCPVPVKFVPLSVTRPW